MAWHMSPLQNPSKYCTVNGSTFLSELTCVNFTLRGSLYGSKFEYRMLRKCVWRVAICEKSQSAKSSWSRLTKSSFTVHVGATLTTDGATVSEGRSFTILWIALANTALLGYRSFSHTPTFLCFVTCQTAKPFSTGNIIFWRGSASRNAFHIRSLGVSTLIYSSSSSLSSSFFEGSPMAPLKLEAALRGMLLSKPAGGTAEV